MSRSLNKKDVATEAELLVAFVNTRDVEEGTDAIADTGRLEAWISATTGEVPPELGQEEVERVAALRESLRALLLANNGIEAGSAELVPLREAVGRSRYRLALADDGELSLEPARSDLSGFEARLLLAIERIQRQGQWPRLKACTEEECQWAFFDTTRNRSRTWCSMDVCGNREKTRRYRQRTRASGT